MAVAAAIGAVATIGSAAIGAGSAKRQARGAAAEKRAAQAEINRIKSQRQEIINPYADIKDLSSMAKDLSGMVTNPYENLGVATQAAEIKMEQTDIALANTLDTLRSTGASAGGATALAQAALQSKKGIAASIEQQEAGNEKLRAQGELAMNQQKMSEQQRLQGIAVAEGQRIQSLDAAGKQFEFQAQENRTSADLDRASGQESQARAQQASANQAKAQAWGGAASGLAGIATSAVSSGGFGSKNSPPKKDYTNDLLNAGKN